MSDNSQNFSIQGYNLVTLLKRLETATSRLEDVTIFQEKNVKKNIDGILSTKAIDSSLKVPSTLNSLTPSTPSLEIEIPKSIKEFDNFIKDFIEPYVKLSNKIDPIVGEQAQLFEDAVKKERDFLFAASKSKKIEPIDLQFQAAVKPMNELIMKIISLKDSNRTSKFFNNLNTVAEGVPALGWICINTPISYIPDFKDSAQFWTNRILKEFKEKDEDQINWAKSFLKIFDGLKSYVKEYHSTGPTWNANGGLLSDELKQLNASKGTDSSAPPAPASGAGGPPPPPPPPPASMFDDIKTSSEESKSSSSAGGIAAVFSELNKGESITSGLKKVDKSQMTHKNPELRSSSTVPAKKPTPPKKPMSLTEKKSLSSSSSSSPASTGAAVKPPKRELVDNKWMITNFKNSGEMITIEGEMDQSIFIANCESIVIQIKGKVNTIAINQCKKVGVVIDKAISSVEVIKSSGVEIQIIDTVPIVTFDQSESVSLYLSATSLDTEIYSSSTSALNINIPDGEDMKELAAPEQFKHAIVNGKLVTVPVEHAG